MPENFSVNILTISIVGGLDGYKCALILTKTVTFTKHNTNSKVPVRHVEGVRRMKLASGLNAPPQGPFGGDIAIKEPGPDI